MELIIAPISPGDSGPLVANLQDALLALLEREIIRPLIAPDRPTLEELQKLSAALKREREQSLFGQFTQELIRYFQVQQGLSDNLRGVVEDTTAARLNEWLKKIGALDGEIAFVVRGRVTGASKGQLVRAYAMGFRSAGQEAGSTLTDGEGNYEIRYNPEKFKLGGKVAANLRVVIFRADDSEQLSSEIVYNAAPDQIVNLEITEGVPPPPSEYETYSLQLTRVLQAHALADLDDKDIDFLAGDTGINRRHIAWLVQAAQLAAKVSAISAQVFYGWLRLDQPAEWTALWAMPTETLIKTLNAALDQHIVPSALSADLDGIRAHIEQIKLDQLLRTPARDSSATLGDFLATSPLPLAADQQRAIAAVTAKLRHDDPLLVEKITAIPGLAGDAAIGVARTLRLGALTAGHLPLVQALQDELQRADESEGSLRPLTALRPDQWLDLAYTHGVPDGTTLTPAAYADALAASVEQQHPTAALAAHFADGRRLAQQPALLDVGTFLSGNPSFDIVTANLNMVTKEAVLSGVAEPEKLVDGLRTLKQMNMLEVRWDEAAILLENELQTPQKILDAGPGQLTALLDGQLTPERTAELHARAEDLFSTTFAAFTAAMSPLSGPNVLPNPTYIYSGGDPVPPDLGGDVVPVFPPPGPFPDDDGSGSSVVLKGVTEMLSSHSSRDPTRYKFPPPARSGPIDDRTPHIDLGENIAREPTLQALFGAQDACVCGHCNSVLSPAAYFVDVLQFIKNAAPPERTLAALLLRRPDLEDIELSCNNTNTELPAIDLALEILENAVAFAQPLEVPLPPGTDIAQQLREGLPVGDAVKNALKKTVRELSGEVLATREGDAWTVVDGHRRWKLTAQFEHGFWVSRPTGEAGPVITTGLDLPALVTALDHWPSSELEVMLAKLFTPKQIPLENYAVAITPLTPGQSWRVTYRSVAKLLISNTNRLSLQTSKGQKWFEPGLEYTEKTIAAVKSGLGKKIVPVLVQTLLEKRFLTTSRLELVEDGDSWIIQSPPRELTLRFTPARLTIMSLTYQSGDANADALAEPENHNPEAYVWLRGDVDRKIPIPSFPWSLPVDLPLEEVRLFLDRARSSRRRLIELMRPVSQAPGDDVAFAQEVLGLSEAEAKLIAPQLPQSDADIYSHWGLPSTATSIADASAGRVVTGMPLDLLKKISILLQQSRLSFDGLQAVLETVFVLGKGQLPLVITPPGTCIPSEMTVPGLTVAHLDRIHRFVRLQRRIKWSVQELDAAIQLAPGAVLDVATLQWLVQVIRLCELLNLPVAVILAWWSAPSVVSTKERARALAQALELTTGEVDHASLLLAIADPFASLPVLLGFCERVTAIRRSDITFEDLRYLLQHQPTPGSSVDQDDRQRAQLSSAVYDAARSIPDAPIEPPLPAGSEQKVIDLALSIRLTSEVAIRHNREDAIIAALATGLGAARELVDELLRIRLRHPLEPGKPAIEVFPRSSLFSIDNFTDVERLIGQLRSGATSITQYLMNQFPPRQRRVLMDSSANVQVLQSTLISALDEVVQGASIYDGPRFSGVTLSADTLALMSQNPTGAELARLNRQLLEEAFPKDIRSTRVPIKTVLVRLHKTVFLCNTLKLDPSDLKLLRRPTLTTDAEGQTEIDFGLTAMQFNSLPGELVAVPANVVDFEQLLALAKLRDMAPRAGDLLHQYAALNPTMTYVANAQKLLAVGLLGNDEVSNISQVNRSAMQLGITTVDHYRDPVRLGRLIELLTALKQLGATVVQALTLTTTSLADAAALSARELLRSKYGDSNWHDLIKPIADKLRERQRDALVDYLVANDQRRDSPYEAHRLRGADDLYERYLIDVQTRSCMKTTRLLQATAAAQLFIQRVLLNLEQGLSLTDDKRQHWEWMDRYRVWEANRKVFLFPENWLLPELRDDKTATFRQMESALTEQEPSPDITRAALLGYVEELSVLAQINVIAMYQDESTLYVVGRTPDQPYRYFWRSCADFGGMGMQWSGWEVLDLDNANDFIMPYVFEGDLHVAWPTFRKTTDEHDQRRLLWEVTIAWQRRTARGWTKRKLGHKVLSVKRLREVSELRSFVFQVQKSIESIPMASNLSQDKITINCYAAKDPKDPTEFDEKIENLKKPAYDGNWHEGRYNVSLNVSGQVWEKYKLKPSDNDYIFRPAETITVQLKWGHKKDGSGVEWFTKPGVVDANGNFSFPESADVLRNPGVINGGTATLIFSRNGQEAKKLDGEIADKDDHEHNGNRTNWTWNPTLVFEIPPPKASLYRPDRDVTFRNASACFVLTASRDMEILDPPPMDTPKLEEPVLVAMKRLGNRFISSNGGSVVRLMGDGDLRVDHDLGMQLEVTPAAVARATLSASDSPETWHLQDASGRYYVHRTIYGWAVWPDGQEFVAWYRRLGAASTFQIFDPKIQAMLRDSQPRPPTTALRTTLESISFTRTIPYANYNWELFLHAPLAIADYLASQQRFEDARLWLHAVFDPTTDKKDLDGIPQFWRFLSFDNTQSPDAIAKLLTWLADPNTGDEKVEKELSNQIEEWKKNPFMPHVIARLRPSAYQWHTFFAYLNVLVGWGDQQFRRDTRESVNEATLLYILAAKLLGPRPRVIPAPSPPPPQTYRSLRANGLDKFGNAWVKYTELPGINKLSRHQRAAPLALTRNSTQQAATANSGTSARTGVVVENMGRPSTIPGLASLSSLAFCIPQNDKLTEFYDLIEKRLFNVRNCRNIDGVFRDLPLYEPPIDPLLLIRARAAGLDINSVMDGLSAPLPHYRFSFTMQKALELAGELKALGGALLAALEKKDAEELTLLRSSHEVAMLRLVSDIRKQQKAEAEANITALRQSEETIKERFGQYQKLLGKAGITNGQDGLPVVEQSSSLSVSTDPVGGVSGLGLSRMEVGQLIETGVAHNFTQAANEAHVLAGVLSIIPNLWVGAIVSGSTFGGSNLGSAASAIAKAIEMGAADASFLANQMGTFGGYERRQDEWVHQSKLALAELKQIKKQIVAAEIRKEIADLELRNHEKQIENAEQVDEFMRSKFSNKQLYRWMSSQIAEVYFRTYQLALGQAKRAERTYQNELGLDAATASFVGTDYWDNLKKGLMAGDRLYLDLKRMEIAYLNQNKREYEITKHVSLMQLDPLALLRLKLTGQCEVSLPEALFDLDFPGHYLRRIKSVSLTIPCVVGPYTTVPCTLTILKHSVRHSSNASGKYARDVENDDSRFTDSFGAIQSIVTSSAQNDSGLFETNLRDERYLPFEGTGAISSWRYELPMQFQSFDYDTISDVVLHVRYTAREGGGLLRDGARAYVEEQIKIENGVGAVRLFSIRHEFPAEWAKFQSQIPVTGKRFQLTIEFKSEHYPFWSNGRLKALTQVDILVQSTQPVPGSIDVYDNSGAQHDKLAKDPLKAAFGNLLVGELKNINELKQPAGELNLFFDTKAMSDLWIAISWNDIDV